MQRLSRELHQALAARVPVRAALWGGQQTGLPLYAFLASIRASSWMARPSPDEVVLAGDAVLAPMALALGRTFGRPVAAVAHGLDVVYPNPLHQMLVPPALRQVDAVLAISASVRALCLERGVVPDRCVTAGCAVQSDAVPSRALGRRAVAARLGIDLADRPVLLTTGRLVARKGVAWFVGQVLPRILESRPDLIYIVVGEGPERGGIEAAAATLPDRGGVQMLGRVDDATRCDLLAAADLFVMPNRKVAGDAEGFGLVAAEAAHASLPTVACAVDSVPEAVIDGATGSLVPPESPEQLAACIVGLLADEARRRLLGSSARSEAVRRFDWAVVGDRYAEALAATLRQARS